MPQPSSNTLLPHAKITFCQLPIPSMPAIASPKDKQPLNDTLTQRKTANQCYQMNTISNSINASRDCLSSGVSDIPLPAYHKRAFSHNYYAPFIYHNILKKKEDFEDFGKVKGNARIPYGNTGCAYIEESKIGRIIAKEILSIQKTFPWGKKKYF